MRAALCPGIKGCRQSPSDLAEALFGLKQHWVRHRYDRIGPVRVVLRVEIRKSPQLKDNALLVCFSQRDDLQSGIAYRVVENPRGWATDGTGRVSWSRAPAAAGAASPSRPDRAETTEATAPAGFDR